MQPKIKWKEILLIVSNLGKKDEVLLCFNDSSIKKITPKDPLWEKPYFVGQKIPFKVKNSRV